VGEDREGALTQSLEFGFREKCEVSVLDPASTVTRLVDHTSPIVRARRRMAARHTAPCFLEAVEQLCPDVTFVLKGSGIDATTIERARSSTRVAIYYPDNPFWRMSDTHEAQKRLAAADLAVVWSTRIRNLLRPTCRRVEMVPFGYDERWFPLTDPGTSRAGVAFVGTWHPRRERYLRALDGLPLTIIGSGWSTTGLASAPPAYGTDAGSLLQRSAIGVNIFHPHNAGAHNMRTREIAACGALQLTDPGEDGTPLRDGDGCRWFRSPAHLRDLVEQYLAHPDAARKIAGSAQGLVSEENYRSRANEFVELFRTLA
jgi:hypothetical protein